MLHPTGLDAFAGGFPDRTFDVGIAEQHAVTSAAGMAMAGLHPVVAIYATFLNRAFDQVLMDAALHRCGVTFVLDRAGVTGEDGPSHNGMWDMSILQVVPGPAARGTPRRDAAPRAAARGGRCRRRADGCPVPEGRRSARPRRRSTGSDSVDVMVRVGDPDVLVVACRRHGRDVRRCRAPPAGAGHRRHGRRPAMGQAARRRPITELAASHRLVVSVEDNGRVGGVGSVLCLAILDAGLAVPVRVFGLPQRFLEQGKRAAVLDDAGLDAQTLAREITAHIAALDGTDDAKTSDTAADSA